jgi:hypothetical protein
MRDGTSCLSLVLSATNVRACAPPPTSYSAQLRAYTHLSESLLVTSPVGEAVHQSLVQANSMGLGDKYIASLITAQERLHGVKISSLPDDASAAAPGPAESKKKA